MPVCRRAGVAAPFAPIVVVLFLLATASRGADDLRPYHELQPIPEIVALTPGLEGTAFAAVLDSLEAKGVRVPVAVVGAGLILLEEPGARVALAAEGAITTVLSAPAPEAVTRLADARVRGLLRWWNDGFEVPRPEPVSRETREAIEGVRICNGARTLEEALAERGGGGALRCGPAGYGRTHFIQGRSIVSLIRPESEGQGNASNWTDAELASTLAQLTRACNWWTLKANHTATFVIVDHGLLPTTYETAAPDLDVELPYIEDCMAALGYGDGCGYEALENLNEDMKARYGGNWGWTEFILDADAFVNTNALAYAYLGGPHTVTTRGVGAVPDNELARIIAHEMGHIYQALDEYDGGCFGCGGAAGYLDVPNDNCVHCPRNIGRCIMRNASTYTPDEAAHMETAINPCEFTRGMVGLWDSNRDGIADVITTYPNTEILNALPDTLEASLGVTVAGNTWDVPFPAPLRFGEAQTINTIRGVQFSVDAGEWRGGFPVDGFFSARSEPWLVYLPELGGGRHRLRVRGLNSVGFFDRSPAEIPFFVHDVTLRDARLDVYPDVRGFGVDWQVEGEDFGGMYHLHRRRDGGEEVFVADIPSRGGRNDRHHYVDLDVDAGHRYQYRLEVDIAGRGTKTLAQGEDTAVLPDPPAGSTVSVAPNPSADTFLFSVAVPRGPRSGSGGIVLPGTEGGGTDFPPRAPDPRAEGDPEDPRNPFTPLWRDVRVHVFDLRGRLVRDLGIFREQETARFNVHWDGRNDDGTGVPSGVYFLRVTLDYASDVTKITLVR